MFRTFFVYKEHWNQMQIMALVYNILKILMKMNSKLFDEELLPVINLRSKSKFSNLKIFYKFFFLNNSLDN